MVDLEAGLGWREFATLVQGFGPQSIWFFLNREEGGPGIEDSATAERMALEMWGESGSEGR